MTATTPLLPTVGRLAVASTVELLCTLSLVVVVLNTNEDRVLFLPAIIAMAVGILRPAWSRRPAWWLVTGAVIAVRQLTAWEGVDNHVVVTTYWCLALGLGLLARDRERTLATSARLLIALVFGFAVYWKFASPDFVSGDFFRFTLLVDERFRAVATWIAGVPSAAYDANHAELARLYGAIPTSEVVALTGGPRLGAVAVFMTWFAIATETAIALVHAVPLPRRRAWWRPATLLFFCVGTYLVVPVGGFGCLLVVLALADPDLDERWRRGLLWLFAGLVVYGPVWRVLFG